MAGIDTGTFEVLLVLGTGLLLPWFFVSALGGRPFLTAPLWFMVLQLMNYFGTLVAADWRQPVDREWLSLNLGALLAFTFGVWLANRVFSFRPNAEIAAFGRRPLEFNISGRTWTLILAASLACAFVGVLFAVAVGYNVFSASVSEFVTSGGEWDPTNYSTMRTSISTDRYVAVGHAVQFTAILMPLTLYLAYFRLRQRVRLSEALIVGALTVADLYFLTVTGGRGWLLYAGFGFLILVSPMGPLPAAVRKGRTQVVAGGVALLLAAFYVTATLLMGRAQVHEGNSSEIASGVVSDLFDRLVGFQAQGELILMRYFLRVDPVWGAEWWEGLLRAVPGMAKPQGFGTQLHAMLFRGDTSGSLGLTTWGSWAYNWGVVGTLAGAVLIGFLMQAFTVKYVRGAKTVTRAVILFAAGYRLGGFRDPYSLLLEGFPTTLLFYAILEWLSRVRVDYFGTVLRAARRTPGTST